MSAFENALMRSFGRPKGILGWLGGKLMASMNKRCAAWVIGLLDIRSTDRVLEIGFGPGVAIQLLVETASPAHVDGIDPSKEMVRQATARNATAIGRGQVDLHMGPAERLPFDDNTFDKMLTINSMQVWQDSEAALAEIRRVVKGGGTIALAFTIYSGQKPDGLVERLAVAGFTQARLAETDKAFCVLATNP